MQHKRVSLTLAAWSASAAMIAVCANAVSAAPAFPGAEGFGGTFTGTPPAGTTAWFQNATVYHVTNTNDSGLGSLRGAFVENSANKIVVFDVAGTFNLTSANVDIKNLANYYIAGQTAPGPVTVYGDMVQLTHSGGKQNSNVILRHMSFRKGTGDNSDAITFAGSGLGTNLILDHVSASWSEDEILSVANNNTNVTVQYSIIHDALVNNHAYGSLIRPRINSNVTFHHNFYANNASRQARFGTYDAFKLTADFRNNVIYNWRNRASYAGGSSEAEQEFVDVNYVGNYLVAGPGTVGNAGTAFIVDKNVDVRAYQSGNFIDPDKQLNPGGVPNGSNTGWNMFAFNTIIDQTLTQMGSEFAMPAVTTQSAADAYQQVINYVGNHWWARDAIDTRVINNVLNNTNAPGGIGAAAPNAAELAALTAAPTVSRPANWDTDADGMPDAWETAHGLNPNSAADKGLDFDTDGYVNVVEYLNEVGAFPAPAPTVFSGATNNRYALTTNWNTWQPSRFDEVQINSGSVGMDSVGQHARVLKIATNPGDTATLHVTGGWIDIADTLHVGPGGSGTVLQTGGVVTATSALIVGNITASNSVYTYAAGSLLTPNIFLLGGGRLALTSGGNKVLTTSSLLIDTANNSTLDLNDNDMIIATTPRSTIESYVVTARNEGAWDGAGITSTAARNNAAGTTTLAVVTGAEYDSVGGNGTFAGVSYLSSDTLVKYTYEGDANLSGSVNFDDYVRVDLGFNTGLSGWVNGDFNYSGGVDFDDYVMIDVAFNSQGGTLSRAVDFLSGDDRSAAGMNAPELELLREHFEQFGVPYAQNFLASVPEPGALGGGVTLVTLLKRKRRSIRQSDLNSR